MIGRSRARRRRDSGQALVEFALVAPFLFILILGTIEAGRFIFLYELMNNATREGARYAIVHGADAVCPSGPISGEDLNNPAGSSSCDFAGARVQQRTTEAAIAAGGTGDLFVYQPVWTDRADLGKPSPGDSNTGSNDRGNYVTVFVDYSYKPLIGEVMDLEVLPDLIISAESTLVINY